MMQQHGKLCGNAGSIPALASKAWMGVTGIAAALETRKQTLARLHFGGAHLIGLLHWRFKPDAGIAPGLHRKAPLAWLVV